ncbi:voltage-gated purine nucleotide uniporter SLC17A9 isoform X4 [Mustela nigripes]|uniref:voltage-gated purine nucleotide uniporter SLC17A9 isoform X4 n=1 Tax=Mustela nigripes TaxID=77151 RepID=UPI00281614CB|nr:voltage-gated purine nucleotide uniporter SLC17A9 isoform X4 [Mustela nigripes]
MPAVLRPRQRARVHRVHEPRLRLEQEGGRPCAQQLLLGLLPDAGGGRPPWRPDRRGEGHPAVRLRLGLPHRRHPAARPPQRRAPGLHDLLTHPHGLAPRCVLSGADQPAVPEGARERASVHLQHRGGRLPVWDAGDRGRGLPPPGPVRLAKCLLLLGWPHAAVGVLRVQTSSWPWASWRKACRCPGTPKFPGDSFSGSLQSGQPSPPSCRRPAPSSSSCPGFPPSFRRRSPAPRAGSSTWCRGWWRFPPVCSAGFCLIILSIRVMGLGLSSVFALCLGHTSSFCMSVVFASASIGLQTFNHSGISVNIQDLAPSCAGFLFGVANTAGALAGVVGVCLGGYLLETTGSWASMFNLVAAVGSLGLCTFLLFGEAQRVDLSPAHEDL